MKKIKDENTKESSQAKATKSLPLLQGEVVRSTGQKVSPCLQGEMSQSDRGDNKIEIKYPFSNALMFSLVMQDKNICKGVIERLLPDKKIKELKLVEDDLLNYSLSTEATILTNLDAKSVRLDVLFEDENEWYDIEMQVDNIGDLAKRSRYYKSAIDVSHLKKGENYSELKPCYVIFLCKFDYFDMGETVYKFEMIDDEKHLKLNDQSYIIIVNTESEKLCKNKELKNLLDYISNGKVANNDKLVEKIHQSVCEFQVSKEARSGMFTLYDEIRWREQRYAKIDKELEKLKDVQEKKEQIEKIKERLEAKLEHDKQRYAKIDKELKEKDDELLRNKEELLKKDEQIKESESKGKSIGEAKKQREIAKAMKDEGTELSFIAKVTGLTLAEIEEL